MTKQIPTGSSSAQHVMNAQERLSYMLPAYARLTQQAHTAFLRVLTGKVAHQVRNPLAAIHAVCSSLHAELKDPDHQERLDMTLHEVQRVLSLISTEVQVFAKQPEPQHDVDVADETADVLDLLLAANPNAPRISLTVKDRILCKASRIDLRVAMYSLLNQAIEVAGVHKISVVIQNDGEYGKIEFIMEGTDSATDMSVLQHSILNSNISSDAISLMVTERFARDVHGRLSHRISDDGKQVVTLELPFIHV